jgi:Aspartate-semialdehyde dehydrogenase
VKKEKYNVAVVGATGAVGEQMREVLEEREFPVDELRLLASERSAGSCCHFKASSFALKCLMRVLSMESTSVCFLPAAG